MFQNGVRSITRETTLCNHETLMVSAIGSFVAGQLSDIKPMGYGVNIFVSVSATILRMKHLRREMAPLAKKQDFWETGIAKTLKPRANKITNRQNHELGRWGEPDL